MNIKQLYKLEDLPKVILPEYPEPIEFEQEADGTWVADLSGAIDTAQPATITLGSATLQMQDDDLPVAQGYFKPRKRGNVTLVAVIANNADIQANGKTGTIVYTTTTEPALDIEAWNRNRRQMAKVVSAGIIDDNITDVTDLNTRHQAADNQKCWAWVNETDLYISKNVNGTWTWVPWGLTNGSFMILNASSAILDNDPVEITFSQPIAPGSLTTDNFKLKNLTDGVDVNINTPTKDATGTVVTLDPIVNLDPAKDYEWWVSRNVTNINANVLSPSQDFSGAFDVVPTGQVDIATISVSGISTTGYTVRLTAQSENTNDYTLYDIAENTTSNIVATGVTWSTINANKAITGRSLDPGTGNKIYVRAQGGAWSEAKSLVVTIGTLFASPDMTTAIWSNNSKTFIEIGNTTKYPGENCIKINTPSSAQTGTANGFDFLNASSLAGRKVTVEVDIEIESYTAGLLTFDWLEDENKTSPWLVDGATEDVTGVVTPRRTYRKTFTANAATLYVAHRVTATGFQGVAYFSKYRFYYI